MYVILQYQNKSQVEVIQMNDDMFEILYFDVVLLMLNPFESLILMMSMEDSILEQMLLVVMLFLYRYNLNKYMEYVGNDWEQIQTVDIENNWYVKQ